MAEELKTIQTVDLSPFKCMVMTIGELPSSFVESMTYYEALAWLDNYLEKTLIPAVNNNAEAVKELQDLYIELHDYVKNYFDNLDVQEEINNKLDEMAEDGQLTQLIAQFLSLNAVMSFPSVAAMKLAENLVNGSTCETYGFYNVNDGGGAKYLVREITNQDTVDEVTLFALYDNNLVAELVCEDTMNVKQFGAKGDGITDETSLLNKIFTYCNDKKVSTIKINEGTYNISDSITIYGNCTIEGANKNATTIVMTANSVTETNHYIFSFINKSNLTVKNITFKGAKPLNDYTLIEDKLYFGLYLNNSTDIIVNNCGFEQMFASALSIRDTSNVIVTNSSFKHNGWNDIALTKTTNNVKIDKNSFQDIIFRSVNAEDGEMNEPVTNIIIVNNTFDTTNTSTNPYAITFSNPSLSGDGHRYQKIIISNNIINNTYYGISYKFIKDLTISNNIFNCGRGIGNNTSNMTDYNRNVNVTNNIFNINHTQSNTYACEFVKNFNLVFSNNIIKNTISTTLTFYLCKNVKCINNEIQDSQNIGISANGENIAIVNNTISNTTSNGIATNNCINLNIKNNSIINTGSDAITLGGNGKYYRVTNNYIFNATRYGVLFPSGSAGNKFATLQNNQFGEDRETPVFTYGYIAIGDVDYVVIENTYLLTSGIYLKGSSHWGTHCTYRNNEGFGTLPA